MTKGKGQAPALLALPSLPLPCTAPDPAAQHPAPLRLDPQGPVCVNRIVTDAVRTTVRVRSKMGDRAGLYPGGLGHAWIGS
jgi:hypothetical protein